MFKIYIYLIKFKLVFYHLLAKLIVGHCVCVCFTFMDSKIYLMEINEIYHLETGRIIHLSSITDQAYIIAHFYFVPVPV